MTIDDLKLNALRRELRDIPTDENDCIEIPFYHWPAGTFREKIWHWFEALGIRNRKG